MTDFNMILGPMCAKSWQQCYKSGPVTYIQNKHTKQTHKTNTELEVDLIAVHAETLGNKSNGMLPNTCIHK